MIFVILGTQDKPFFRLVKEIEKQVIEKKINEEVVVQAGITEYKSKYIKMANFMPMDEFEKNINDARIIITHAGVGSIITALKANKKIIAVPRLKKYGEHVNDHQLQIANTFENAGYLLVVNDTDNFENVLKRIEDFKPDVFITNQDKFVNRLENRIDKYLNKKVREIP
ncbi:MAG: PssE/Cps14G family polysaccharide biosynthesis glycosyltransferase [Clostridia bacterium]|nr:PssE/Cps14G family polysaccharide biosynthesis glycosyltransferase [Clostridia bacterium]